MRQVDSSLLDEWERLRLPVDDLAAWTPADGRRPDRRRRRHRSRANRRAFRVMVRNACFRRVELVAARDWTTLGELDGDAGWTRPTWLARHGALLRASTPTVGIGPEARGAGLFQVTEATARRPWRVRQVLDDPDGYHEWAIVLDVDLAAVRRRPATPSSDRWRSTHLIRRR